MCQVALSQKINAPADVVWDTVKDFQRPGKYLDAVIESTMQGSGIGAVRSVKLTSGDFGIERMVHLDEVNLTVSYILTDTSLPLSGYIAVMHVRKVGEEQCALEWSSVFDPKGITESEAVAFVEKFYAGGFKGMKKRHEK